VNRRYQNRHYRNTRKTICDINVTPFVDVMLVLLVVFMVTSPLMIAGVKVDLPETSHSPITSGKEPLSVTVDKDDNIYLQDTKVEKKELALKLKLMVQNDLDSRIFVRGDKQVDYGKVMEVLDLLSNSGFNKISLVTSIKTE
jgi:biopolymer transport protein TolR